MTKYPLYRYKLAMYNKYLSPALLILLIPNVGFYFVSKYTNFSLSPYIFLVVFVLFFILLFVFLLINTVLPNMFLLFCKNDGYLINNLLVIFEESDEAEVFYCDLGYHYLLIFKIYGNDILEAKKETKFRTTKFRTKYIEYLNPKEFNIIYKKTKKHVI